MLKRLPLIPTLLVLAAVAVMIRLGFWQIDRMHQKDALLAHYAAAGSIRTEAPWPKDASALEQVLYRRATLDCAQVAGISNIAGQNARGEPGLAVTADCRLADGARALVVLGWAKQQPRTGLWAGGPVSGIIAPGPRLVADPPLAGLDASARPDPTGLPNNHWSYAVQWFLFAATALVIYGLALRKRLAAKGAGG